MDDDTKDDSQKNKESSENQSEEKKTTAEEERYMDFYVRLRENIDRQLKDSYNKDSPINKAINLLALLPDLLHLNIKLLFDGEVKANKKGAIVATILYVISPIDLIPDIIPAFGWLDDLISEINKRLESGWNPLFQDKGTKELMVFKDACKVYTNRIEQEVSDGNLRPDTKRTYLSQIEQLYKYLELKNLNKMLCYKFNADFIN